jgi:hypothetical protein
VVKPHHCRYCGDLLRTWHEREDHIAWRATWGECHPVTPMLAPEKAARVARVEALSWDLAKMRERLKALP